MFKKVDIEENTMRLDRWFKIHYPDIRYGELQKLLRTGQIRVDSKRVKADTRLQEGQLIRLPPMFEENSKINKQDVTKKTIGSMADFEALARMTIYEDAHILVLNKPAGIAVQGGSGVNRHIDGMLECLRNKKGVKPRLVHRLDKDTSGVLLVGKTRQATSFLADAFKNRETKKVYWALVIGVPKKYENKVSTWLVKQSTVGGDIVQVCKHGTEGSDFAISYYRLVEQAAQNFSWLEMEPYTGRTHQLRVHAAYINHPILGDPKYFHADSNWCFPGGIQNKLHLHARSIICPHPVGGQINVKAPLPQHMIQSFNLLGFDKKIYLD